MLLDLHPGQTRATLPHGRPRPRPISEAPSLSTRCSAPLLVTTDSFYTLELLCLLSHPCNPSSFMQLRTLLRNGAPVSLVFSMLSALFLSPRGVPILEVRFLSVLRVSVPLWQVPLFHTLAASLSSSKKSSPLQSGKSSLFLQSTRGGVGPQFRPFAINNFQLLLPAPVANIATGSSKSHFPAVSVPSASKQLRTTHCPLLTPHFLRSSHSFHGRNQLRYINPNHRALPRLAGDFQAEISAVQHAQPLAHIAQSDAL